MTIRVVVADDQLLVRTGLTMILNAQPGIEVVGEATDGHEAVAVARELRPDVCLFDIRMPGIDGVEATRQLAGPGVENPLAIVVITTFDLDEYVHGALKAGAAYLPLDPELPAARLAWMLRDARPALAAADDAGRARLAGAWDGPLVDIDADADIDADGPDGGPPAPREPAESDLAYVIYTSGSTGTPKAVTVEHRGLAAALLTRPRLLVLEVHRRMVCRGYDGPPRVFGDRWASLFLPVTVMVPQQDRRAA